MENIRTAREAPKRKRNWTFEVARRLSGASCRSSCPLLPSLEAALTQNVPPTKLRAFEIRTSHQKCPRTARNCFSPHLASEDLTQRVEPSADLRSEALIRGKADRWWACSDSATCGQVCVFVCVFPCVGGWVGRQLPAAAVQIDGEEP